MRLWLVGQYRSGEEENVVWEFQGIFTTQAKAEQACRMAAYFVAPVELDQEVPDESFEMPDAYFPLEAASWN